MQPMRLLAQHLNRLVQCLLKSGPAGSILVPLKPPTSPSNTCLDLDLSMHIHAALYLMCFQQRVGVFIGNVKSILAL